MTQKLKSFGLKSFMFLIKPLFGSGIGRIKFVNEIYSRTLLQYKDVPITINDYQMYVYDDQCQEIDSLSQRFIIDRYYEPLTTKLFRQLVQSGMVVVDVGANIGYFTLLSSKLVGASGKVIAFEPDLRNYALLKKNLNINDCRNVVTNQNIVSNTNKKTTLYRSSEKGSHSIYKHEDSIASVEIDSIQLDDYFSKEETSIDVIKIDVEGAEVLVLEGMKRILDINDKIKIFIEFSPLRLKQSDFSVQEYLNQFFNHKFNYIYILDEAKTRIEKASFQELDDYYHKNDESINYLNLLCSKTPIDINF